VFRDGVEEGVEMTQTLYAHMNKKKYLNKMKREIFLKAQIFSNKWSYVLAMIK
jgi:hypothetical protein